MSESVARVYTNTSRRASNQQSVDRKPIYRSVLGNPFHVEWPTISPGLQQSILIQLTALFDGVAAHYQLVGNARKKARLTASSYHKGQADSHVRGESNCNPLDPSTSTPPIILHITAGINEVTKSLETEARLSRQTIISSNMIRNLNTNATQPLIRVIFICHSDLGTPALVSHLPQLVALCNSERSEGHKIKVVQLPVGAQTALVNALGYLKRISVMALDNLAPGLDQLEPLLATVPDPPASWLISTQKVALEPSHIKQLLTSSPKDMKVAKVQRARGRAAAKEKKRVKSLAPHGGPSV
ncbi:hypothetical protein B0F90DRAFT_1665028 [Multifurca ochricompacta]|uniref:Uncharacterized protein n=1 Tax=Multifurca ochricompacta TaxID=376703 RepID=A0AAD4MD29_9AGAM|nr:hypothetical protein B0F90DRAFT_1665028 [Multifurca ochricompacta]